MPTIDIEWKQIGEWLNSASLSDWKDVLRGINSNDAVEKMIKSISEDIREKQDDWIDVFEYINSVDLLTLKALITKDTPREDRKEILKHLTSLNKDEKCHS